MVKSAFRVFAALALACGTALPAQALPATTAPAPRDAFEDLYQAMLEGIDEDRIMDRLSATIAQQIAMASPAMIEAESRFPGLSTAIAQAVKPALTRYSRRVSGEYHPRMIAVIREMLSETEARDAAALYRMPIGRKLMGGLSANYDGKATLANAIRNDGKVTAEAVEVDQRNAARQAMSTLTSADLAELNRLAKAQPGLLKLGLLGEKIGPVRVEMESAPMTKAEEAEMGKALNAAMDAHIAKFRK